MIRVRFFGKFSDLVGSEEGVTFESHNVDTIDDIVGALAISHQALHEEITGPQVMVALNQQIVPRSSEVNDGDEVAFLPPVTGG